MRGAGEGRDRELVGADAIVSGHGVVALAGLPAVGLRPRKIRDFERKNQGLPDSVLDNSGVKRIIGQSDLPRACVRKVTRWRCRGVGTNSSRNWATTGLQTDRFRDLA